MSRTFDARTAVALAGLLIAAAVAPYTAQAQEAPAAEPASQEALLEPLGVSPGGAFLRAVLVPGWGHVAIGSHTRGGFYFALESLTGYAFLRTRARLSEARDRAALRESVVRAELAAEGITDFDEIQARLDQDETLTGFQDLVESREGQQEDLVAWGIFLLFLSGADAYVSAHLGRFPAPLAIDVSPLGTDRAEVALRIQLPNLH
jgi:hypothetical protein